MIDCTLPAVTACGPGIGGRQAEVDRRGADGAQRDRAVRDGAAVARQLNAYPLRRRGGGGIGEDRVGAVRGGAGEVIPQLLALRAVDGERHGHRSRVVGEGDGDIAGGDVAAAGGDHHVVVGVNVPDELEGVAIVVVGLMQDQHRD